MYSVIVAVSSGEYIIRSALRYMPTSTHSDSAPFISVETAGPHAGHRGPGLRER